MKSISKKIKSIYLLAIMAILSVCMAVFPVFKTESVKAEEEPGLSMTGAYLQFSQIDAANNGSQDFALMFQAKITKTLYDTLADKNATFGMAIGPASKISGITAFDQLDDISDGTEGNAWVYTALVGTGSAEASQLIEFADEETEFIYEAGTYFSKLEIDGLAPEDWQKAYATELVAIPFYTVDGTVVFDASLAATNSASKVAFDTFIAETVLPTNSEERTISDNRFKAITGYTLVQGFGSNEQMYLHVYKKNSSQKYSFLTNFMRGADQDKWKNWSFLRPWFPWQSYAGSGKSLGANKGAPTYFAGGELLTAFTAETTGFTATNFTGFDNIQNLTQGEQHRLLFKRSASADDKTLIYDNYIPATVITGWNNLGSSTEGQTLVKVLTLNEGGSQSVIPYFTLKLSGSNLYMPYSKSSSSNLYERENNDGYYVLAGDIIVPEDITSGTQHYYLNSSGKYTTVNTFAAPSALAHLQQISMGALKAVSGYINTFNTYLLNHAFTGTFDGRGYTIEGPFTRGGLLGAINGGTVKNLNVRANFYSYGSSGTTATYLNDSYMEKASILAEVICGGATLENISIELKENAPATFAKKQVAIVGGSSVELDNIPEMNNVPGIIAAQEIERTTLKNVVVRCDSLKDVGNSIQNYRAALNIASNCTVDNVFVIGSSYTNMSINVVEDAVAGTKDYVLTLSAPEGIEPGTYVVEDNEALAPYFAMAADMFKYMRNVDVSDGIVKVKFIAERAKKFANEEAFQGYLADTANEEAVEAKSALLATGMWAEDAEGAVAWKKACVAGTKTTHDDGITYKIVAGTKGYTVAAKPTPDASLDVFGWVGFAGYNPSVTLAG